MRTPPTRGETVILAGGIVTIVASFLAFYTSGNFTITAWDSGLSPIAVYPVFAGGFSAAVVALRRFAGATLNVRIGGFTWEQVHLLLGLFALLITGGYFWQGGPGSLDLGLGFWGMFGGSIALLVGAVMFSREPAGPFGPRH